MRWFCSSTLNLLFAILSVAAQAYGDASVTLNCWSSNEKAFDRVLCQIHNNRDVAIAYNLESTNIDCEYSDIRIHPTLPENSNYDIIISGKSGERFILMAGPEGNQCKATIHYQTVSNDNLLKHESGLSNWQPDGTERLKLSVKMPFVPFMGSRRGNNIAEYLSRPIE